MRSRRQRSSLTADPPGSAADAPHGASRVTLRVLALRGRSPGLCGRFLRSPPGDDAGDAGGGPPEVAGSRRPSRAAGRARPVHAVLRCSGSFLGTPIAAPRYAPAPTSSLLAPIPTTGFEPVPRVSRSNRRERREARSTRTVRANSGCACSCTKSIPGRSRPATAGRCHSPMTNCRRKSCGFRLGWGARARSSFRVGDERMTSPKGRCGDGRLNPPVRHLRRLS